MERAENKNLKLIIKALDAYQATMLIINSQRQVVFVNKVLCDRLGISRKELLKMTVDEYMENTAAKNCYAVQSLESGESFVNVHQLTDDIDLEVTSYPITDDKGNIIGAIGCGFDNDLVSKLENIVKETEKKSESLSKAMNYMSEKSGGDGFVYADKKMKRVFDSAGLIAATDSTVLVTGESGTGKEIIANYIHNHSNRKDGVFMPVNCGAIPENLIESEFFGYDKGAFTGADKNGKAGLFEIADKGTLFLDEIGELPMLMQAKLLRVLETGEIKRVGGSKRIFTDVRIIAATNKNLEEMVKQNKFREDLYYRLSVIPLSIPPLRERPDDVEVLMQYYAEKFNKKYKTNLVIDQKVLNKYKKYVWPGNVRELRNEVERLAIYSIGKGGLFEEKNSHDSDIRNFSQEEFSDRIEDDVNSGKKLKELVEKYEKDILKAMLEKNNGNVRKTAMDMGIDRSSFYRKIKDV